MEDDSFKTASPVAAEARKVALGLLEWSAADVNKPQFGAFVKRLFTALKTPLISFSRWSCNREILWRDYFLLRSSKEFISNWHLRRKIEHGNHEELVLCLMALVKSRNDEEVASDEEWTRMLDRGGLWYIKETSYSLFCAIEEETRYCLKTLSSQHGKC